MDNQEVSYEVLPDDYTQYDLSFKLIVIGDSGYLLFNSSQESENLA